jgi:hypothetical protein
VFHAPQSGHLPIHRGDWAPQDWQTWIVFALDFMMKVFYWFAFGMSNANSPEQWLQPNRHAGERPTVTIR